MKNIILFIVFSFLFSTELFAQNNLLKQNNAWLEKEVNRLIDKDSKDQDVVAYRFKECNADMNFKIKSKDNGVNFGMGFGCTFDEITTVNYKKETDGSYSLLLTLNKKEKDNNNLNFSLYTKDEKLIQEIKKRFEQNILECRKIKK